MPLAMPPRAVFLFNHDAGHQVAHMAGIAAALALGKGQVECVVAYGTPAIADEVRRVLSPEAASQIIWHDLSLPPLIDAVLGLPNRLLPARRLARLRAGDNLFATAHLIVSTERTCLRARRRLRARLGDAAPQFVYIPHGSGDRNVAYHPELAQFDHMLLSGQKLIDEMVARGLATPDRCHLIGYPKFDAINQTHPQQFFDNGRPTFIYNPHFDPKLSSWYDFGPDLLRHAAASDQYNLIFAPHVMLFRKKLHISLEYRTARRRPEIPAEALAADNILIDVDGPNLFNMTYTLAADGYIGDMSSQVYEFLIRRRPVFFIDTHSADYPDEAANRSFWANGPVVTAFEQLAPLLANYRDVAEQYRAAQDRLFSYTIDNRPGERSVDRGAQVLRRLIHSLAAKPSP